MLQHGRAHSRDSSVRGSREELLTGRGVVLDGPKEDLREWGPVLI